MFYGLLLAMHLLVCLCLVGVILIQSGKGGGLAGGAFGGATQTVFGGRGATDFITRATIVLGVTFFVTSLSLAIMTANASNSGSRSILQEQARKASAAAQRQPATSRVPAAAGGGGLQGGPAPSAPAGGAPAGGGR